MLRDPNSPPRLLVKLAYQKPTKARDRPKHGVGDQKVTLRPLFPVPDKFSKAAETDAHKNWWFLAEIAPEEARGAPTAWRDKNPWDIAHDMIAKGKLDGETILAVEPDLKQKWPVEAPPELRVPSHAPDSPCEPEPQRGDPLARGPGFAWHLGANFSQLKQAREDKQASGGDGITIVHLDTGYDPDHAALPVNLAPSGENSQQRNFVDTNLFNDATDRTPSSGLLTDRGHGTGTLCILAGRKLNGVQPNDANSGDYLGGAPLAKVVPVRVADSVVHFWTSAVGRGIDYARMIGADVISMSMGGLPSASWADAVNAAYEAGIVIVCAAGNNFGGLPTPLIVYPARFRRVIAACGVMADGSPYSGLPPYIMEGNFGPPSKMDTALAAYTPNIPWAKIECKGVIDLDGAGTSAATPQIAAAAALWLRKYKSEIKDKYSEPWRRVEAVRKALFESAYLAGPASGTHFGRGILKARKALEYKPIDAEKLKETPRDNAHFSLLQLLVDLPIERFDASRGDGNADPRQDLFGLELTQLALCSVGARAIISDPDADFTRIPRRQRRRLCELMLDEGNASAALRQELEARLGRHSAIPKAAPGSKLTGATIPRVRRRPPPAVRRLQIFAIDPGASSEFDTAFINQTVVEVRWEASSTNPNILQVGPVGEYIEVVDVDPASDCAYDPVDLNDPYLLAEDGLAPSEGNPQFHQQMVYAVTMRTIDAFEAALGRAVLWAPKKFYRYNPLPKGRRRAADKEVKQTEGREWRITEVYVPRLRIYPHALRQANAYYTPDKVALLFGYFPEARPGDTDKPSGGLVFTCLSHDIVVHETTHALLDGMHRRYEEASNIDVLAFHEAFADIVAIFQHFTLPGLLRHEINRCRGDLRKGEYLAGLAQQFGRARGLSRALRSAIHVDPETRYDETTEAHNRGSILVSAIFGAFLTIYRRRIDDLLRIATGGTGELTPGALHPDLVERLAIEAVKSANHILQMGIRALDYCPPVDITFSDYLRAMITADADLVPNDKKYGYRVALLEAFRNRGIFPKDVRTYSVESLHWAMPDRQPERLAPLIKTMALDWSRGSNRERAYATSKRNAAILHEWLKRNVSDELAQRLGLNFTARSKGSPGEIGFEYDSEGEPSFEVHAVRPANRVSPSGDIKSDVIIVITQQRDLPIDVDNPRGPTFKFRGGCTLIVDPAKDAEPIRYAVVKSIWSETRITTQREFISNQQGLGPAALYFGGAGFGLDEPYAEDLIAPFANLHLDQ